MKSAHLGHAPQQRSVKMFVVYGIFKGSLMQRSKNLHFKSEYVSEL